MLLAGFAAAFVAAGAAAQTTTSEDLVVTGNRTVREMAQDYAGAVAVAPGSADQYARWNRRLCPRVAGLPAEDAQTLIDHIAMRAHEFGIEVEPTGCSANFVIIFTPDSDTVARQIVDSRRDLLGYYNDDDLVTDGREGLERFATTPRAVRWWHVARTTTADGQQLGNSGSRVGRSTADAQAAQQSGDLSGGAVMAGNGYSGVEAVRSNGTRTRRAIRQDLSFALMIVDTRRIEGLPPQAVADYLSMATLVQLDPQADLSAFPTVLNLFSDPQAGRATPTGMTDWDIAYLHGLYDAQREAPSARAQRNDIAGRISRSMERASR